MTAGGRQQGARQPGRRMLAALALGLIAFAPAAAQDAGSPRGLRFGLDLSTQSTSNARLTPGGGERQSAALAGLSLAWQRETRADSLRFSAGATLRAGNGTRRNGLTDPRLSADWTRSAADGSFSFRASVAETDIEALRDLSDFIDPDTGLIDLPEDFTDLQGTGTRRNSTLGARLTLGDDRRAGVTLRADLNRRDYSGTSSTALVDSRRLTFGADLRLDLDAATQATLGLSRQMFEEDRPGAATRDTDRLDFGLSRALPAGSIGATLGFSRTPEGTRIATALTRRIDLPDGSLSGSIGLTRPATDSDLALNWSLAWSRQGPDSGFGLDLRRAVGSGTDDSERVTTTLAARYDRTLGPRDSIGLRLSHAESRTPGAGGATRTTSLGLNWSRALTEDWSLRAGINLQERREPGGARARSDQITLGLGRAWEF